MQNNTKQWKTTPSCFLWREKVGACVQHCGFWGSTGLPFQMVFVSFVSECWWDQYISVALELMRTKKREVCLWLAPAPEDPWQSREKLISLAHCTSWEEKSCSACPIFWFYGGLPKKLVPVFPKSKSSAKLGVTENKGDFGLVCTHVHACQSPSPLSQ